MVIETIISFKKQRDDIMNIRMTKLKWDPAKKEAFLAACDANQQNVGKTPGLQYG